ncbi:hypothetical protein VVD49_04125 [Uliginosibacterium sp. H3]|uniref:HPF/RaiA family ribosome-associated protein n=1 Tax=Uliginosibacterium silvisoli TaxID=3114758 RepID=A0ABU6JYZ1_9RHOO|nr:hypothetical protein [Uliginosibacterium sp. H3]
MLVLFESRHAEGAQWRELAVRRVRFVLRRLTWFIPRARVKLFSASPPADSQQSGDTFCHLELRTGRGGIVVITSRAADWRAALDAALARAARAMLRIWKFGITYTRAPRLRARGHGKR